MARIAGVDLPRDKRVEVALGYIYGISRRRAAIFCSIPGLIRRPVRDLTEDEANRLRNLSIRIIRWKEISAGKWQ